MGDCVALSLADRFALIEQAEQWAQVSGWLASKNVSQD